MGQYYNILTKRKGKYKLFSVQPTEANTQNVRSGGMMNFEYFNGQKLMEHSWEHNHITDSILKYIEENPTQVAWVGDYADDFKWETDGEHPNPKELHELAWGEIYEENTFNKMPEYKIPTYLVNHTKKLYLNMAKYSRKNGTYFTTLNGKKERYVISPLPLLTVCGNGMGGGDYEGENMDLVGSWCFDELETNDARPSDYIEIEVTFKEKGYEEV